jgi:hypothetical protein
MGQRHNGQRRRSYARRQHELRQRRPGDDRRESPTNEESLDWGLINLDAEERHLDSRLGGHAR